MARGQHTNVIEPPKRTAHNLAYAAEQVVQVIVFTAVATMLLLIRTWPAPLFMLAATVGMVVTAITPQVVNGRIIEYVARRQGKTSKNP